MEFTEKTIESEYIYNGKILNLRRDKVKIPGGRESYREIVEHNGGGAILAINEKKEIIMVRQFRKPFEEVLLEIPAGKLEKDENPLDCGIRELEEETGFKAKHMELMNVIYPSPGFSDEKLYIYFCDEMEKTSTNYDEDEIIQIEYIPYDRAVDMIYKKEIADAKSITGILMAGKYIKG
jgi:ADP-ribose pyrophosphatase